MPELEGVGVVSLLATAVLMLVRDILSNRGDSTELDAQDNKSSHAHLIERVIEVERKIDRLLERGP